MLKDMMNSLDYIKADVREGLIKRNPDVLDRAVERLRNQAEFLVNLAATMRENNDTRNL